MHRTLSLASREFWLLRSERYLYQDVIRKKKLCIYPHDFFESTLCLSNTFFFILKASYMSNNSFLKYNGINNTIVVQPPMLKQRKNHRFIYLNNSLFVIGGSFEQADIYNNTSDCERFDLES